ncbi:hypothetical protein [Micropruina sonneratiae]|uniref:hypothetical protein n=1 Tax=Micropruina sonneratiae TaxID=2986940 RepID=UPI002225B942|nr:hypothetical protein [Micropruina sp. KQZ13P-5]MCW3159469.1 hypothetical protein [Micropruina sp. KQZ13P-5]
MDIATRRADEVVALAVATLGLDPEILVLEHPETICASLRRAASFLCPTTPRVLVDTTLEVLNPLLDEPLERDEVATLLEQLISTGDLLELAEATPERSTRLLYLGPPSYVEKVPGQYLLTGIRSSGKALVPDETSVEYVGHKRAVVLDSSEADSQLKALGLHRIGTKQWIGQPSTSPASAYLEQFRHRLAVGRAAGHIDGLTIIDPAAKPTYYHGRWRPPSTGDSGDFVGRRPQAYGSDLWCLVRLVDGNAERLIDLPFGGSTSPARDQAWRLQAAIDAERGAPQSFRTLAIPGATPTAEYIVDLFAPLPSWAERYLELAGNPVDRSRGALFSYRIPAGALEELQSVLTSTLWMSMNEGEGQ